MVLLGGRGFWREDRARGRRGESIGKRGRGEGTPKEEPGEVEDDHDGYFDVERDEFQR